MDRRKHPQLKQQTVAEIFKQEWQLHMYKPLHTPFPYYRAVQAAVNSHCLIHLKGKRNSAPCHLARRQVSLHIRLATIQVVTHHKVVAEHQRIWTKGQTSYNPWHYLPLLKRKPGALCNGEPFKHWLLPEAIQRLRKHLMQQPKGDRAMVEILTLIAEHGEEVGIAAAELVLESGMPTVAAVQNIISRLDEPVVPKFNLPDIPLFIPPKTNLQKYNRV